MSSQAETPYFWQHLHNMFPARTPAAEAGAEGGTAKAACRGCSRQSRQPTVARGDNTKRRSPRNIITRCIGKVCARSVRECVSASDIRCVSKRKKNNAQSVWPRSQTPNGVLDQAGRTITNDVVLGGTNLTQQLCARAEFGDYCADSRSHIGDRAHRGQLVHRRPPKRTQARTQTVANECRQHQNGATTVRTRPGSLEPMSSVGPAQAATVVRHRQLDTQSPGLHGRGRYQMLFTTREKNSLFPLWGNSPGMLPVQRFEIISHS
ncbi:uncharacterized protein B0H64DRAFT_2870 [Chaetomium fimeti]|uniref:Uncharacterized protein n=1 Tax=Chaetomium fimeti TaxID=1854472 RepID=A0AAE0LWF6_9PEZI|nr:hypothetical protein B0H64DRAFT_2870 [Chaetomium fimeti]